MDPPAEDQSPTGLEHRRLVELYVVTSRTNLHKNAVGNQISTPLVKQNHNHFVWLCANLSTSTVCTGDADAIFWADTNLGVNVLYLLNLVNKMYLA